MHMVVGGAGEDCVATTASPRPSAAAAAIEDPANDALIGYELSDALVPAMPAMGVCRALVGREFGAGGARSRCERARERRARFVCMLLCLAQLPHPLACAQRSRSHAACCTYKLTFPCARRG